jgi:hypothetical protein
MGRGATVLFDHVHRFRDGIVIVADAEGTKTETKFLLGLGVTESDPSMETVIFE